MDTQRTTTVRRFIYDTLWPQQRVVWVLILRPLNLGDVWEMARILTESQNWVPKFTTTQVTWNEAPEKPTDFKNSTSTHNAAIMYVLILCTLYKEHIINWTQKIRFVVVRVADLCLCWYTHYRFGPAVTFSGVEWKQQLPLKSWGTYLILQTRLSYTYSITHIHQQFIHTIRHYRNSTTDAIIRKRTDMRLTILTPQGTVTSMADSNMFLQLS
jgi:hypothetical protein